MKTLKDRIQNIQNEILKRIQVGDFELEEAFFEDIVQRPFAVISVDGYKMRLLINLDLNFFFQLDNRNEDMVAFPNSVELPKILKEIGENVMLMNKKD